MSKERGCVYKNKKIYNCLSKSSHHKAWVFPINGNTLELEENDAHVLLGLMEPSQEAM